jgi:LytS/YehU family sensor histidine kinase
MSSNTACFFYTTNSKAYLENGNYKEAMFWIKKAEEEEATKSDLKAQLNILKLKIEIAKNAKKTDEIIAFYEKYIEIKEILINESKQNAIEKFEAKYQNKLKEKEKEILRLQKIEMEQKALRAQLNPHFFFNSLNSINKYIVDNDSENASNFLFKFSSLMRKTLENSEESFLTIEEEVEFLNDYLSLEQLRFNNSFKFDIIIDKGIEDDFVKIPTMMIQPYIENSIKHGFNSIKDGMIKVEFQLNEDDSILCIIEDNGSGRVISQSSHKSMGTNILENRIKILKEQYQLDFHIKTIDLKSKNKIVQGTRIELLIPCLDLI